MSVPNRCRFVLATGLNNQPNVNVVVNDGIPQHLKCPICIEVFGAEIFQCQNGHVICDRCKNKVSNSCPQCRVPLVLDGGTIIRVRAMEALLDSMMPFCPYKTAGCTERVFNNNREAHMINCIYNGKCTQLCKNLGYSNCGFWTNGMTAGASVHHFMTHHKAILTHENSIYIKLVNFGRITEAMIFDGIWAPMILTCGGAHFLVETLFNAKDRSVSWICLKLNYGDALPAVGQYEVEFRIADPFEMKPPLKWKMTPVSLLDSGELVRFPPFRTPVKLLEENYCNPHHTLKIQVSVSQGSATSGAVGTNQQNAVTIDEINPRTRRIGSDHCQFVQ